MNDAPARIHPITRRRTFRSTIGGKVARAAVTLTLWVAGFAIIGNGGVHLYAVLTESSSGSSATADPRSIVPTVGRSSFVAFPPVATPTEADSPASPTHATEPTTDADVAVASAQTHALVPTSTSQPMPSPTAEPRKAKAPPVRLRIEGIGVDAPVVLVHGETLPREPIAGWYFGTAFPGDVGNVVLLGHLNGDGELFGDLDLLRPGDAIHVDTTDGTVTYVVEGVQLADRRAIELLGSTPEPTLTLMTCAGDWRDEIGGYDMRLVVQARLAS